MTSATITTIKDNSVILPRAWKGARVVVRVNDRTATITRMSSSSNVFTSAEIKQLRKLGKNVTKAVLGRTLKAAR